MQTYLLSKLVTSMLVKLKLASRLKRHSGPGPRSKAVFNVGAVRRQRELMRVLFDFLPHEMTARLFGRILYRWRPIRDKDQFVALDAPVAA